MSDDTHDDVDAPAPAAPVTADSFTAVAALLALATDPRACRARLLELQRQIDAAGKAQAKLAAEHVAHEAAVARDRAQIEEREKSAQKREASALAAERNLEGDLARIAEFKAARNARMGEGLFGGLTREIDDTPPEPDPHFRTADEAGFVSMPAQPPARRSMRRGQEV